MKKTPLAFAFLALATLTACDPNWRSPDVTRVNKETGEVQMVSDVKEFEAGILKAFPDVPVPATHKMDMERTTIFTSNNQSLGKIVMEGSGDVASLYHFFSTEMPSKGWSLVNGFQSGTSSLYYAKPGKFVAIIMEQVGRRTSRVTLNVGPE
jgi:hypothetical protein